MQRMFSFVKTFLQVGHNQRESSKWKPTSAKPFAAGQVWAYTTRPGEEASRIVICHVESDPRLGQIVHIHVRGLRMKNKRAAGGSSDQIGHMPYSASALRNSVTKLESTVAMLPPFEEGYRHWRDAFERGEGGIWTASLSQTVEDMEHVMNK